MLEDLHIGVAVRGSDGRHLGTLKRIVVARESSRVTHIVVEEGLIESGNALAPGGWDKPRGRVIPVALVAHAGDHDLTLSCDEPAFKAYPLFEEEHAIPVEAAGPAGAERHERFETGEVIRYIASAAGAGGAPYLPPESITYDERPDEAEIGEGTPVWRRQPHEEVGEVERVLADPATQRVSALVVKRKGIFGPSLILPIAAVGDVEDGVVHITLSRAEVDALPHYSPEK
ncbi:MAG TPA: hypothetical protein VF116_06545 [Ktedonobacterales bacterium]